MTPGSDPRFDAAAAAIDAANAGDPNRIVVRGVEHPKELGHAELGRWWLDRLRPDAGDLLRLAVRGAHVRRWAIRRDDYPPGRAGYLRWRRALKEVHAEEVGRALERAGYASADVSRVQDLVRKKGLGHDPDTQALEDVLCLVFLETQLHELAGRMDEDHLVSVVRKTLPKMSDEAKALALDAPLQPAARAILERALDDPPLDADGDLSSPR